MSTAYSDKNFNQFLKDNQQKILATTPINPSIPRNDEWVNETEWDLYNQHLRDEETAHAICL